MLLTNGLAEGVAHQPRRLRVTLEKAFTAKDAKDAKEYKGQNIVYMLTASVFAFHSTSPLISFDREYSDFRVEGVDS
jgi:hypothetical protein